MSLMNEKFKVIDPENKQESKTEKHKSHLDFLYCLEDELHKFSLKEGFCSIIINLLKDQFSPHFAGIYIKKDKSQFFKLCSSYHYAEGIIPDRFSRIDLIFEDAIDEVTFFDLRKKSHEFFSAYVELNINYLYVIPLSFKDEKIGYFLYGDRKLLDNDHETKRFFSTLGKRITVSLNHRNLFDKVDNAKKEWEATFDAISNPVLVKDINRKLLSVNKAAKELLPHDDIEKIDSQEVFGSISREETTPFERAIASGKKESGEIFESKTGKYVYVTCFPVTDKNGEIIKIIEYRHDITPLLKAYSKNELLALALKTTRDCIIIYDPEEKILFANDAVKEVFGYDNEEIIGKRFTDFFLKNIQHEELTGIIYGSFIRGWKGELTQIDKNGHEFPATVSLSPAYGGKGDPLAVLVTIRDITMEKETQKKLFHTEKLKSLGEMISGISHELNNPLTGIVGFSEFLEHRIKNCIGEGITHCSNAEGCLEDVQCIKEQANRAVRIIRNLLDFSKNREPSLEEVDVNKIVKKTLDLMKLHLQGCRVEITTNLGENLPHTFADFHQIQQVLVNMINNACQAVEPFRSDGEIIITTFKSGSEILIKFDDNGPGIPEKLKDSIFVPFFTTKKVSQGTGLGLSLSYRIMKNHKGNILVRNNKMGGASFTLTLPIIKSKSQIKNGSPQFNSKELQSKCTNFKLLIADSNQLICNLISNVTKIMRFKQIDAAKNCKETLELIEENNYDLIIADFSLSGKNGERLFSTLVNNPHLNNTKIIFSIDDVFTSRPKNMVQRDGVEFLTKPFTTGELIKVINKSLSI